MKLYNWLSNFPSWQHFTFSYKFQQYPDGAVTVYALSMHQTDADTLQFSGDLAQQDVDVYLLTPGDSDGVLSK